MDELFGLPVAGYALTLAVIFAILAGLLIYIAARNTILVKMALRNVVRRPARGVLVVTGLMLATAIISIAFTTGDSVTFSIKNEVTEALRELDEFVGVDEESDVWDGQAVPDTFPESLYEQIGPVLEADPDVDATLPVHVESVAVANLKGQRFEVNAMFQGLRADRVGAFEELVDTLVPRLHGATLVAHNLPFDVRFLRQELERAGVAFHPGNGYCTYRATKLTLSQACAHFGIPYETQHRALVDARVTARLAAALHPRIPVLANASTGCRISS